MQIKELPQKNTIKAHELKMCIDKKICKYDISPFPNTTGARVIVVGQPRAGKSSLILNAIKDKRVYKKQFDNIYLLAPANSLSSLKDFPLDQLDQRKIINELDEGVLLSLREKLEDHKENDESSIVVIDDWASSLKNHSIANQLNHIFANARHLNVVIFVLVQTFRFLPDKLRKMASDVVLVGKPKNKQEMKALGEEIFYKEPKEITRLFDYAFKRKHDFIWVKDDAIYRNFRELEIEGW